MSADTDKITYGYDGEDRLTSSAYEGVFLPSSTTKVSVSVVYDAAGEQVQLTQPETTTVSLVRKFPYNGASRPVTYADGQGTTTELLNVFKPRGLTAYGPRAVALRRASTS